MQAVVVIEKGKTQVKEVEKPQPGTEEIVLKNHAVALNPTDWKHRDAVSPPGALLGCDFAGTVESVGSGVTNVKEGDRVAGFVHGGRKPDEGSFAQYVKAQSTLVWKVPSSVSWEEAAASGGIAPLTAVQALYLRHKLQPPSNPVKDQEIPVLVWGGTSSVGMYAVQLLKLSGYKVLATSSEKNWPLLKSLGVDSTYDYSDAETPKKIASDYPSLSIGFDCISEHGTTSQMAKSFKSGKGKIITLLPVDDEGLNEFGGVEVEATLVYTVLGRPFYMWRDFPAMPEDKKAIEEWLANEMPELMGSGKLKSNPLLSRDGGLNGINEGLDYLKAGKNRAQKLTYKLD
ncbi:zinc-binding alcohol dehydrogenase family protein [Sporobolomyces salmoneus]|uniref:zinc-binding alcohol dehydrogenase family protein n=1 Tax=Sporobolomyces salmoneus TaxID=183962 RepID=UPI003181F812